MEYERGFWVDAGSWQLKQDDRYVLRHDAQAPKDWRQDRKMLEAIILREYPDATGFRYRGGVLRFRWNGGEGSGRVYESATTAGPLDVHL